MAVVRRYPSLLEINTRVWLSRLSRESGKRVTLADIGDSFLDEMAACGFEWIWLLSVWQTGEAGRQVSRRDPALRQELLSVLPDLMEADICGSGFAISAYRVSEALGGATALAAFRARLASRGIRLMLDFVPNHTAPDHHWVASRPALYVQGSEADLARAPESYLRVESKEGPRILAHGRDPNFPAWEDTLQLDYANANLQAAQIEVLDEIAGCCDGLRCDMAMLLLPEVFERTWGVAPAPFWPRAIPAIRARHPGFVFMAEVYWDLEWTLQRQGFDYCYDKRLYDRLRSDRAPMVRAHFNAGLDYQDKLARFLENHDEPRAAAVFPLEQQRAAAIVTYLSPGLRFFNQGQTAGARIRVPVHLCRGPAEPVDRAVETFYRRLLSVLKHSAVLGAASWSKIEPERPRPDNPTAEDFIAFAWSDGEEVRYVVVVNYAGHRGQCYLKLPFPALRGRRLRLVDEMGIEVYERDGSGLIDPGLYIDLPAWHYNVFRVEPIGS